MIAVVGELRQAVVNDDGRAPAIDDAVVAEIPVPLTAAVSGGDFQLEVAREGLDLVPGAAVGIEMTEIELGEIAHEDVVQVDDDAVALLVQGLNLQGQQDRI